MRNTLLLANGCSQPIAAGREPVGAAIRTTAVLRKLPEGQFTLLGRSGRWRFDPAATAMSWSAVISQKISLNGGFLIARPAGTDTEETFPSTVVGVSDRFKSNAGWVAGDGTNQPLSLSVCVTETSRKADMNMHRRAGSSGRTFSWDGGSRACPGVHERIQTIMKQWVGNARGDQSVRFAWEKRVGRDDFRGG